MVCEMESDLLEEMDIEVVSSMWPEDINDGKQFNIEIPESDRDMLKEVTINEDPSIVDFQRLAELTNYSEKGSSQLAYLLKYWNYKQANAVRLLEEEIDNLSKQRQEVELKRLEILEEHRFEQEIYYGDKRPISILDGIYDIWEDVPSMTKDVVVQDKKLEIDAEFDTVLYWKQRAMNLEKLLEASVQREQILLEKLQESLKNLERQSSPVEELSQMLKRSDNFLHFILQNAPFVIGHQDKELRYRFIYNHFPSLDEKDIIGKTDVEIFTGTGVKESQDFKREVLERGLPAKREITFETELFGSKTFLIYVEPVFSKAGETIGVNYMGMEITDQVRKREKMFKIREEIAVQKAKETELNKTIHITEETMRAKQMLATMSHEIRSPLSGVVSMTEILSTTNLDKEQRQLLNVMLSSGDLVLQLINDILDLSKVESGVMKLEATKFRPREVVRHVLQTAAASLKKTLVLEGNVSDDVPVEVRNLCNFVIGDVLRIRQILTNLISNAIKFTHDGKVGIKLYVVTPPSSLREESSNQNSTPVQSGYPETGQNMDTSSQNRKEDDPKSPLQDISHLQETVWICCDVHDTGIGIPEHALPTLFKKYMQVGADTARKYGGTGLGLAICKQLVELMGGHLSVNSKDGYGSTFTFVLPYKVSNITDDSDDQETFSDMEETDVEADSNDDSCGFFQFHPRNIGSLFSSNSSTRMQKVLPNNSLLFCDSLELNGSKELPSLEDAGSIVVDSMETQHESSTTHSSDISKTKPSHKDNDSSSCCIDIVPEEVPKAIISKPRILLVEDSKINVMVAQSMMKQLGHKVDVVNNGAEAVRAVQGHCYDLILMDVCMPIMNGLQATRLIRSYEETGNWDAAIEAGIDTPLPSSSNSLQSNGNCILTRKRVPIVMTANALSESGEECFANGMDSFVSKPVTFQTLKQCLEQYLA
ncbi:histidine kinase 5 [Impatiens glandulifera]|uniref:histidine kinase 5 n=1 Tax=Impatiens glandulifera TaxID=253017 RepID=UPI001FB085DB|nr:histidine kinase 5 [Impatiens glandulifera]